MNKKKDLRMYCLVLRSLSPIQQGIQSAHAVVEYNNACVEEVETENYYDWAMNHKTMIVLNGGTTRDIRRYQNDLRKLGVTVAHFEEPDLGNITTALAFIVDTKNETHISQYLRSMRLV